MQLNPKQPPGRSSRKALRYVHEVHRLRAEGHTFESIRLALLDVGISVSASTVRREATRPPSAWKLDRRHEVPLALVELQPTKAAPDTPLLPQPLDASIGELDSPSDAEPGLARIEAVGNRRTFGVMFRVLAALRRLCGAGHVA
jgi:hypothetical protein